MAIQTKFLIFLKHVCLSYVLDIISPMNNKVVLCKNSEKNRTVFYKNYKLSFNSKIIKYRKMLYRIENQNIAIGEKVFIENCNVLSETVDFQNLTPFGIGTIIGVINGKLIAKHKNVFTIYSEGNEFPIYFRLLHDKLQYKMHTGHELSLEIYASFIHGNCLVVSTMKNILFMDFENNLDVQYKFKNDLLKIYVKKIDGIKFLATDYLSNGNIETAIFFDKNLLTAKFSSFAKNKISIDIPAKFYDFKNIMDKVSKDVHYNSVNENISYADNEDENLCNNHGGDRLVCLINNDNNHDAINIGKHIFSNDELSETGTPVKLLKTTSFRDHSDKILQQRHTISNSTIQRCLPCDESKVLLNQLKQYTSNHKPSELDINTNNAKKRIKLSKGLKIFSSAIERKLFKLNNSNKQLEILERIFKGMDSQIFEESFCFLFYCLKNTNKLMRSDDKRINLMLHDHRFFFYLNPNNFRTYKFNFEEFLSRKYNRIFFYNEKIINSKNLAYYVIENEKNSNNFKENAKVVKFRSTNQFIKTLTEYYKDVRILDVLDLLVEDSIEILTDLNDLTNCRQIAHHFRSNCNLGAYLLNNCYEFKLYDTRKDSTFKDKDDFIFLNGACLMAHYKNSQSGIVFDYGMIFGTGIVNGTDDKSIQESIKLLEYCEEKFLKYLILIISTRSARESSERSTNINFILKSYLDSKLLDIRKASLCALAIYNTCTHNEHIIKLLINECDKFGPLVADKNAEFYDREYRILSALCCAIISKKGLNVKLNDTFCELLINGLSSIGKMDRFDDFDRNDDCRPQEVFYSELLNLCGDFSVNLSSIIGVIRDGLLTFNIYRMAAKIFYVSLYIIRNSVESPPIEFLLGLALQLESLIYQNKSYKILFNYSLISLSIILNGTCNLELIRILRRQIIRSRDLEFMEKLHCFDIFKKDKIIQQGVDYESINIYKTCLGLVCSNYGLTKLSSDSIKQLIITFFFNPRIAMEFSFVDILKLLIAKSFQKKEDSRFLEAHNKIKSEIKIKKYNKNCIKAFYRLNYLDKKIFVDVVSDYFENFHFDNKDKSIFNFSTIAKLISITK